MFSAKLSFALGSLDRVEVIGPPSTKSCLNRGSAHANAGETEIQGHICAHRLLTFFTNEAEVVPNRIPEGTSVLDRPSMELPRILETRAESCIDEESEALYLTHTLHILVDWLEEISHFH